MATDVNQSVSSSIDHGSIKASDEEKSPAPKTSFADNDNDKNEISIPSFITDHAAERALCRKFDFRLLPFLAIMYLFNALDKGNLGNAKTDHMDTDLHFRGDQYNILLSVFYVPYVVCAPFGSVLGKKYGPHRVLPLLMASFGTFTILSVAAQNWGGMMTLRWFLGMFQFMQYLISHLDHVVFHSFILSLPRATNFTGPPREIHWIPLVIGKSSMLHAALTSFPRAQLKLFPFSHSTL